MTGGVVIRRVALGVILLAAASVLRLGLSPVLLDVPDDYSSQTNYAAESRFRDSPDGEWQHVALIAQRVDHTQINAGSVAVIQGDMHWFSDSGQVIFENTGLYGVNRHTRMNVPDYGNVERMGLYLFPPHFPQTSFTYWDPMFIGERRATFDHAASVDGLTVYVFRFSGSDMDETAGYRYLPHVPERYRTLTDGQGTLWIEPLSGVLVDYEEQGTSYFVDAGSGVRLANFFEWSDRYTPETKAAQISIARAMRWRILALEVWLPGGLALAGGLSLLAALLKRAKP